MALYMIDHANPDCVGDWSMCGMLLIKCSKCQQVYHNSGAARLAAIDENYAGIYLRKLADEGQSASRKPFNRLEGIRRA